MKALISAASSYLDRKKAESAAEAKAWREAKADLSEAAVAYDVALDVLNKGWEDLEASCYVKDKIQSAAMSDAAAAIVSKGMEAIEEAAMALDEAEAAALTLAKGNHKTVLHKTKYMLKTEPIRTAPYL